MQKCFRFGAHKPGRISCSLCHDVLINALLLMYYCIFSNKEPVLYVVYVYIMTINVSELNFWIENWFAVFRKGLAKWTWDFTSTLHEICSSHFDPPEVLRLAEISPMNGGNVALMVVMNTRTSFYDMNYVQKQWALYIIRTELPI